MAGLIPSYTYDTEQLWTMLISRNKWIIKLRYVTSAALALFTVLSVKVFSLELSTNQYNALLLTASIILIYNLIFSYLINSRFVRNDAESFNPMHISFMQIIADQVALAVIVYYTGGIESPFYQGVFHN
ncbi:MAG: hypothetical protein MUE56_06575, partial [Ignavibacteria bacterium]|nr:hypothetical protein [Ignavibacteria bacterium]